MNQSVETHKVCLGLTAILAALFPDMLTLKEFSVQPWAAVATILLFLHIELNQLRYDKQFRLRCDYQSRALHSNS